MNTEKTKYHICKIKYEELKTDRSKMGFILKQTQSEKKAAIETNVPDSPDFERLSVTNYNSPCWLHISLEKIKKNRRTEISIEIDKEHAIFLVEKMTEIINKLEY